MVASGTDTPAARMRDAHSSTFSGGREQAGLGVNEGWLWAQHSGLGVKHKGQTVVNTAATLHNLTSSPTMVTPLCIYNRHATEGIATYDSEATEIQLNW